MLKKLNMSMLVAASIASASAFAAYGPAPAASSSAASNWTLGFGYGQMFGMKKTTNNSTEEHKVDKPTLFEVDLFNSKGFGAVYMTSAKKKGIVVNAGAATTNEYSFDAYMLGYQKAFANNMTWRLALGLSDQKHVAGATINKSGSEFAYAASAAYHMALSGKLSGFVEAGYLGQKEFIYNTTSSLSVSGSGFYAKVGAKMPL